MIIFHVLKCSIRVSLTIIISSLKAGCMPVVSYLTFLKFSEKMAVKYADAVIADNKGIQDYVREEYGKEAELIAYGGDHVLCDIADVEEQILEKYGLKNPSMMINFQYTEATDSDDATTEAESETDTSSETANETEPAEILSGTLYVGEQAEDGSYYVQLDGSNNI